MDTNNQALQITNKFSKHAALEGNEKWEKSNSRLSPIYKRKDDIRSNFERDYDRILHSNAYRRLKRKTQVFFSTSNDHICTRIEHVQLVASISATIAKALGLNDELVSAISVGHDLGHSPFGHHGEVVLNSIVKSYDPNKKFWQANLNNL